MSKRSFKTCNTDAQKTRWKLKVAMKKLFRSWTGFRDRGGKERDHTYHWARMLRKMMVVEQCLLFLEGVDKERVEFINKKLNRLKKKMEPYREPFSNITAEYGSKKRHTPSKEYRKTVKKELRSL